MSDMQDTAGLPARKRKPLTGVAKERRERLGRLLEQRRGELGFTDRTDFARARPGLTWRTYTDLENGYRENSTIATLGKVAAAYGVTYDSMLAVAHGESDCLEPAPGTGPRPVPAPAVTAQAVPVPEELREAAQPYADEIQARLLAAAARTGTEDPPGDEVFGPGSWEAQSWDLFRRQFPSTLRRLWIIAAASVPDDRAPGRHGTAAGLTAEAALDRGSSTGGTA